MIRSLSIKGALILLVMAIAAAFVFPAQDAYAQLWTGSEIKYDAGTIGGTVSGDFIGVRFSLPSGISSAPLLTVRYTWAFVGVPGAENLVVRITSADHVTLLTPPIATVATVSPAAFNVLDVSGLNIVLSGDFWIVLSRTIAAGGPAFDPGPGVGRSFAGGGGSTLANFVSFPCCPSNNLLIRAVIGLPRGGGIGGSVLPVNELRVITPWLILVVVLSTIAVYTLAVRRRRED